MSATGRLGDSTNGFSYYVVNGNKLGFGAETGFTQAVIRNGDVIGILLDLEESTLTYFHNGHILGSAFSKIPGHPDKIKYYPAIGFYEF
ncbi:unnamed protein product, partial [Rotaria magnacalcarata]